MPGRASKWTTMRRVTVVQFLAGSIHD